MTLLQGPTTNHRLGNHPAARWQEALWLLIALLTPLFVNFWVEQSFEASKIWLLRTLIWLLVFLWLISWTSNRRSKPLPSAIRTALILLVGIWLLSTMLSTDPIVALWGSLDRANGLLTHVSYVFLFLCVATRIDRQQSEQLLRAIILTALPICLLALGQMGGWQPVLLLTDARSPLTTTLGRANFTGAYLVLLLPLTVTAAQLAKARWQRAGYGLLVLLISIVVALTLARAAWVAALVGMSVLLWLQAAPRWSKRVRWGSALGGVLAFCGALVLLLQQGIAAGGSVAARWTIWQASLSLLWPRIWLGYGADTLELHFPAVYPPQLVYYQGRGVVVDRAHNWLLDWSLNHGVVATLLFIGLFFLILRRGWQRLSVPQPNGLPANEIPVTAARRHAHSWLAASMAVICAQLVGNLFLFEVAATATLFWLLLAIVCAETSPEVDAPFSYTSLHASPLWVSLHASPLWVSLHASPLWVSKYVKVIGIVVLGWVAWQGNVRPLLADANSWRGTQALSRGDVESALAAYGAAIRYQPQRAAYWVAFAHTVAQAGDFLQAEAAMLQAIALRPTDPLLLTELAALYGRAAANSPEKTEAAYHSYEQAIALAPTIALTYRQYADFALRAGDDARATALAQQAVDLDATDGVAFAIWGWAQLRTGNLAVAQDAFAQALKWSPTSADSYVGLATVHFQQGNLELARQALHQSLAIDPTYPPALTLQVQLYAATP